MKLGVAGGLVALSLVSGCATSFEEARMLAPKVAPKAAPRDETRCRTLADREALWSSLAVAAGVAAGAGGLASIPLPDRYQGANVGLVVGAAILAAGGKAYAHSVGVQWATECAS